jgi:hypothetical protein
MGWLLAGWDNQPEHPNYAQFCNWAMIISPLTTSDRSMGHPKI